MSCFLIGASMSGAAASCEVQPEIGTPLAIGSCVGRVIRRFSEGFAIRFAEPMTGLHDLERRIITPPEQPRRLVQRPQIEQQAVPRRAIALRGDAAEEDYFVI